MLIPVNRPQQQEYWSIGDLKRLISHHPDVSVATSPRSYGKSYAALMYLKEKCLDKGEWCCWGRYNREELKQQKAEILSKIPDLILDRKLSSSVSPVYTDPTTGGHIMLYSWNIAQNLKGVDHPFLWNICDEFIPERYTNKTRLDTEFADWNSCRKSLARSYNCLNNVMLANCIDWFNPFYLKWDVPPFPSGNIWKDTKRLSVELDGKLISTRRIIAIENVQATVAIVERTIREQGLEFSSSEDMQAYFDNQFKQDYQQIAACPDMKISPEDWQIMSLGEQIRPRKIGSRYYWYAVKKQQSGIDTFVQEPEYVDIMNHRYRQANLQNDLSQEFNDGKFYFDTPESLAVFFRWVRRSRGRVGS